MFKHLTSFLMYVSFKARQGGKVGGVYDGYNSIPPLADPFNQFNYNTMITKKDVVKNVELLKERLSKNELQYIKGQDFLFQSPLFWLDNKKDIVVYMDDNKLIFKNK